MTNAEYFLEIKVRPSNSANLYDHNHNIIPN